MEHSNKVLNKLRNEKLLERGNEFLNNLYEEKLKHKEHRNTYVLRKLYFTIGLFGLGSIQLQTIDLSSLLYLIPFVALTHDMYIFAEDYKVKRIGIFLRKWSVSVCPDEICWESYVSKYREPLAAFASAILTLIALTAAAVIMGLKSPDLRVFWSWLVLSLIATGGLFLYARRLLDRLDAASHPAKESGDA